MKISKEVQYALDNNLPVVALETTIISHGMPYPKNVECALNVEKVIKENGATPATIGIIDGEIIIGMNEEEIESFAKRKDVVKVSRRDLPIVFANKLTGATTVSATMILAKKAGIEVFVTGGIGGVHRGANETFDISADLDELGKTDVSVVCAGAKAILDIPLTLEYLETKGVPVIGFDCDNLPLFYTRDSKYKVDFNAKDYKSAAKIIFEKRSNKLEGGILFANPIPKEDSIDANYIEKIIEEAIVEMNKLNIKGKEQTPFLLSKIVELTNGNSLEANIKLILNNAKVGANIAKEYSKLLKD